MSLSRRGDGTSPHRPARPRRRGPVPSYVSTLMRTTCRIDPQDPPLEVRSDPPAPAESWPAWTDREVAICHVEPSQWPEPCGSVRFEPCRLEFDDLPTFTPGPAGDTDE
jgi:hypothetical protein